MLCKPGIDQFGPVAGATTCKNCPIGWNQPKNGSESCVDLKFKKRSDCHETTQYLDDSAGPEGENPLLWECRPCPSGEYLVGLRLDCWIVGLIPHNVVSHWFCSFFCSFFLILFVSPRFYFVFA